MKQISVNSQNGEYITINASGHINYVNGAAKMYIGFKEGGKYHYINEEAQIIFLRCLGAIRKNVAVYQRLNNDAALMLAKVEKTVINLDEYDIQYESNILDSVRSLINLSAFKRSLSIREYFATITERQFLDISFVCVIAFLMLVAGMLFYNYVTKC